MPFQPRLTDYSKGLLCEQKRVYPQHVLVLQRIADQTPLSEIKCLLGLSKQALNHNLTRLVGKGWVERIDFGTYETTKTGVKYLNSISGTSKPLKKCGGFSVNSRVFDWLSVHFFKVRFNLKGSHFDKSGLEKGVKGRWTVYDDNPPTTLEVRKRCLTVTVHGLHGSNATEIARKGLVAARERALSFCARRGARVFECGEFSGMPHWVIEELNTSRELAGLLGLRQGGSAVRLAGLDWYLDGSHKGLVEARGELESAKRVFGEFEYLLSGGLKRDLDFIKVELGSVKDVTREVAALREDLRFVPSGKERRDTS